MKIPPFVSSPIAQTRAVLSTASVAKSPAPPVASGGVESAPAATGGPMTALPGSIDLEAFFAAWGSASEEFDVTKDGTVDGKDLAIFLGASQPETQAPTSPQEVLNSWGQPSGGGDVNGDGKVDGMDLALALGNVQPSETDMLVAGVQKAWGSSDGTYDLNKDGTVDGADLGIALSGGAYAKTGETATPTPVETADATATAVADPAIAETAAKVADSVLSAADSNGDGTVATAELPVAQAMLGDIDVDRDRAVSRDELLARLTERLGTQAATRPGVDMNKLAASWTEALLAPTEARGAVAKQTYGATQPTISPLSDRLYRQLAANGFERRPPANLGQVVNGIASNGPQRAEILRGLAQRYASGLGLNQRV